MENKMKEFLDKVMATAGTVAETAGDFAKETGKKLNEKKDLAKCKTRIMRLKNEMEDDFMQIGRTIYENRGGGDKAAETCETTLAEIFEELDRKDAEIAELTQMIDSLSAERKCPSCGRSNPKDFCFCPGCGEELCVPEEEKASVEDEMVSPAEQPEETVRQQQVPSEENSETEES